MEIKIHKTKDAPDNIAFTGGEYADCEVNIYVDESLSLKVQRELVIHSIIENYTLSWSHDKVEELADLITEGLNQLEEG